jgi:hypothetical protein
MSDETPAPLAAKPPLKRSHLHIMSLADIAFLLDLSAYPGLTYAKLLSLPRAEVVRIYAIAP